jgi:protein-disulfide isomerase
MMKFFSRDVLSTLFTAILTICALIVTGLVIRQEFFKNSEKRSNEESIRTVKNWRQAVEEGNTVGVKSAELKIAVFYDYQCPFCKRMEETLKRVRVKYPQKVVVVYRHFPLNEVHSRARELAVAAECASRQDMFLTYHETLFTNQSRLEKASLDSLANEVGVPDISQFNACISQERPLEKVKRDVQVAQRLGVKVTPTLFINDKMISGAIMEEKLRKLIQTQI